jgi:hypothetical protein
MINLLLKSLQQEAAVAAHPSLPALATVLPAGHGEACESLRTFLPKSLRNHLNVSGKKTVDLDPELVQAVLPTARNGAAEHGSNAGVYKQLGHIVVGRVNRDGLRRCALCLRSVEKHDGLGDVEQRRDAIAAGWYGDFH